MDATVRESQFIHDIAIIKVHPENKNCPVYVFTLNDDLSSVRAASKLVYYVEMEKQKRMSLQNLMSGYDNETPVSPESATPPLTNYKGNLMPDKLIQTYGNIGGSYNKLKKEEKVIQPPHQAQPKINVDLVKTQTNFFSVKPRLDPTSQILDEKRSSTKFSSDLQPAIEPCCIRLDSADKTQSKFVFPQEPKTDTVNVQHDKEVFSLFDKMVKQNLRVDDVNASGLKKEGPVELEIIDLGALQSIYKFLGLWAFTMPIRGYYCIIVLKTYNKSVNYRLFDKNIVSLFYGVLKKIEGYDFDSISTYGQVCYSQSLGQVGDSTIKSIERNQPDTARISSLKSSVSQQQYKEIINRNSYNVTYHDSKQEEMILLQLKDLVQQIRKVIFGWENEICLRKHLKLTDETISDAPSILGFFVTLRLKTLMFYRRYVLQIWLTLFFTFILVTCILYHVFLYNISYNSKSNAF